ETIYSNIPPERLREIHLKIVEKWISAQIVENQKAIFALAHHFNKVFEFGGFPDAGFGKRAIQQNLAAGNSAWKASALQAAQRYFENAELYVTKVPSNLVDKVERLNITEALADLDAMQKRYGGALRKYQKAMEIVETREQ